jgi:2-iminobutanoate/2-iminopropanoate deaminase
MKKQALSTRVHAPFGPYSVAIEKKGMLFLSGQGPFDPDQNLIGETIEQQTVQTMENIKSILVENNYHMDDVVKVTVYLQDIKMWGAFNVIYKTYFSDPMPARTAVSCQLNGFLVEIEAIAVKD